MSNSTTDIAMADTVMPARSPMYVVFEFFGCTVELNWIELLAA
jgi:hypothetical protein